MDQEREREEEKTCPFYQNEVTFRLFKRQEGCAKMSEPMSRRIRMGRGMVLTVQRLGRTCLVSLSDMRDETNSFPSLSVSLVIVSSKIEHV